MISRKGEAGRRLHLGKVRQCDQVTANSSSNVPDGWRGAGPRGCLLTCVSFLSQSTQQPRRQTPSATRPRFRGSEEGEPVGTRWPGSTARTLNLQGSIFLCKRQETDAAFGGHASGAPLALWLSTNTALNCV